MKFQSKQYLQSNPYVVTTLPRNNIAFKLKDWVRSKGLLAVVTKDGEFEFTASPTPGN